MNRFAPRTTITFDCYGTLIDWERGVGDALARIETLKGCDLRRLIEDRELCERAIEAGPFQPYGRVLAESLVRAAERHGRAVAVADAQSFARSMACWPPFSDSAAALARLRTRYRLIVLSNVETEVLESSMRALGSPFDAWITADDVRSYKPQPAHFEAAVGRFGLSRANWLHVAASVYHDIEPVRRMGIETVWVARGAARPNGVERAVPDLRALADELVGPLDGARSLSEPASQ